MLMLAPTSRAGTTEHVMYLARRVLRLYVLRSSSAYMHRPGALRKYSSVYRTHHNPLQALLVLGALRILGRGVVFEHAAGIVRKNIQCEANTTAKATPPSSSIMTLMASSRLKPKTTQNVLNSRMQAT